MNLRLPFTRLTLPDHDREVLDAVEDALAGRPVPNAATASVQWFAARLAAASPHPDADFTHRLEARVVSAVSASFRPRLVRLSPAGRAVAVAATAFVAFVVATGVAMPALGYDPYSPLRHVVFREVETPPVFGRPDPSVAPPPNLHWIEPAELQKAVGFRVYVPTYLPDGCTPEESWYYLRPGAISVHFQYRCVMIGESVFDRPARPIVQAGSVEELEIAGGTALLVKCSWGTQADGLTICDDRFVQLWLEREDTVIVMVPARPISTEDLIKIAGSLQALPRQP